MWTVSQDTMAAIENGVDFTHLVNPGNWSNGVLMGIFGGRGSRY